MDFEMFMIYCPIILLFVFFILRVPVAFAVLLATLVYFIFNSQSMPTDIIAQRLVASMESFAYLAIPFFSCAGVVFNYSGITRRMIHLADLLVGHFTGGLGQVNVLLATLMGGLSGSANADAAMQSKTLVPEMTRLGYGKAYSAAVTASASVITPIIPPGIILILYATASDVSIQRMFFAGYLPGCVIALGLMVVVWIISKRRGYKASREARASWGEIGRAAIDAIWALFLPFGILLGLRFGLFTPTEAGAISVLYALVVGKFIYKELDFSRDMGKILMESVEATAGVMFIIAAANAFGSYLTWERIPMIFSEMLIAGIHEPWLMLLVINLMLLVVGCFFDGGAAMVLLAPLLVPVVHSMGIDLVHFGIAMSINLTIAGMTPPFGAMMFVTTSITGVKIEDYAREAVPFIIALVIVLGIITYVPWISLVIPNLLSS